MTSQNIINKRKFNIEYPKFLYEYQQYRDGVSRLVDNKSLRALSATQILQSTSVVSVGFLVRETLYICISD